MGAHVHLAVAVDRVSDAAWDGIYDRARRVAAQWAPRPLSLAWRQIGAVRVAQYSLELETPEGLHLVGDAETLATGDSFVFPAKLDRAAAQPDRAGPPAAPDDDVLVALARRYDPHAARRVPWRDLIEARTQGLSYHVLLVALGLLVEHSLPGAAVVYGDLSAHDGEQARRGLAEILGGVIELPVVLDPERLRQRLAASLSADALDRAIRELGPPDPHGEAIAGDLLARLRSAPDAHGRHELEHAARSCPDPDRLSTGTRQLLHRLADAIRTNVERELREQIEQWGAARTREATARGTMKSGLRLTSTAWDAIEAADLDELAFLYGAVCLDATPPEVHQAVRAMLENPALRRA